MQRFLTGLFLVSALAGCNSAPSPTMTQSAVKKPPPPAVELDDVGQTLAGVSLLVLSPGADREHLIDVIEHELGGVVYHLEGVRLLAVHVPDGADAILTQLGVATRFDRAVDPAELVNATVEEQRFVRVFDNMYYPGVIKLAAIQPKRLPVQPGAAFERAPSLVPSSVRAAIRLPGPLPGPIPGPTLDTITTPFASGTIVVSILMPESNGVAEPSTEDWTEDLILETYQKIQTAVQAYELSEPNANLRFIIHYESSPGHGGLPGTIDSDFECGTHFDFLNGTDEFAVSAPLLARLVGHPVTSDTLFDASYEYLNNLRAQYHADGAFYVKVTPNSNFTAGFRAHAFINGPWTSLSTDYGYSTFTHEFGHIMGALDEYCPDACVSTTAEQGYLGVSNANAQYQIGGDGINFGRGEGQNSLMIGNDPNAINGFTRGAWGWQDSDGDGIMDVRDTVPLTQVGAQVNGQNVRLQGTIIDQPEVRWAFQTRRSFNHITNLEYRLRRPTDDGVWFSQPLNSPGQVAAVGVDLGAFPPGDYELRVRGRNSVGNVDAVERTVSFVIAGTRNPANTPPRVQLEAEPRTGSVRSTFTLRAAASDLDCNDRIASVRFDTDGDGVFETNASNRRVVTTRFRRAGVFTVGVEVRDTHGAVSTSTTQVYVLDGNTAPTVELAELPSVFYGVDELHQRLRAHAEDADGDSVQYDWLVQSAASDGTLPFETGFGNSNQFTADLVTPAVLKDRPLDLSAGDTALQGNSINQIVAVTPTVLASAQGSGGVLFTDISNLDRPQVIASIVVDTGANQLVLDGKRLYVLGGALTVIDVSNPLSPFEIQQTNPIVNTRVDSIVESDPIPDQGRKGADQQHTLTFGERISTVSVEVTINHPNPAELALTLEVFSGSRLSTFSLRDHVAGPGGLQTYTFNPTTTPELQQLIGTIASGQFDVRAIDDVAGNVGTLEGSTLTFTTSTHAFPVLAGATHLVGTLPGNYVVVAGLGLQVINAKVASAMKVSSLLTGTGTFSATLVGTTAFVVSPTTLVPPKGAAAGPPPPAPQTHGFYAVDLSTATRPVIKRQDDSIGDDGADIFYVGTHLYLNHAATRAGALPTQINDPVAFVNNRSYLLGSMPELISPSSFGTDALLWTLVNGAVRGFDVRNPAAVQTRYSYLRPQRSQLVSLGGDTALLYDGGIVTSYVHLTEVAHLLSRTFRVTVVARDSRGATTRASRTVQVVPYDHPPTARASLVAGHNAGDVFTFQVVNSDPDSGTSWDPFLYTRADLDGDGVFETDWIPYNNGATEFQATFPTSGSYLVRFQTRDTFGARDITELAVDVP